jgi:hypothetical protein
MIVNRVPRIEGAIAYVPLGKDGKHGEAKISLEDYQWLMEKGISPNWFAQAPKGFVGVYVGYVAKSIARILLDLPRNLVIKHKDGDLTNLLRDNLEAVKAGRPDIGMLRTIKAASEC